MDVIFKQLGHLFLQSAPTVILVFVLFVILDRIFFRPLMDVLKQREDLSVGAQAQAREQTAAAEAKTRQYEEAFQSARQEVYRQREVNRRTSIDQRDGALRKAHQEAETVIAAARASLSAEVSRAKTELDSACQPLAEEISQVLLATDAAPGGQERLRF